MDEHAALGALIVVMAAFGAIWFAYPQQLVSSDPWRYSQNAYLLAHGAWRQALPNHPFGHRLALLVPVAAIYRLAGVSLHTTHLWPLLAALAVIAAVWWGGAPGAGRAYAAALCALCLPLVWSAVSLYPDIVATAFVALSAVLLAGRRRCQGPGLAALLVPVAAVGLLFAGFMAKETALWVGPLWVGALVWDLRSGERQLVSRFYAPALVTGLAIGLLYLFFCDLVWADPLARLHSLNQAAGEHLWSLGGAGAAAWARRLLASPWRVLLVDYGILAIPAAIAVVAAGRRQSFWSAFSLVTIAMFWLCPTSLVTYAPIAATWRNALICLPGLAILAGEAVGRLHLAGAGERPPRTLLAGVLVLAVAAVPLLGHLDEARRSPRVEAAAATLVAREAARRPAETLLLVTADTRSAESLAFYFGYSYPPNLSVRAAAELARSDLARAKRAYVFLDEERSRSLAERYGEPDLSPTIRSLGLTERLGVGGVTLYQTDRLTDLAPLLGGID